MLPSFVLAALASASYEMASPQGDWKAPARAAKKKNPVPAVEKSTVAGQVSFMQQCAACHGPQGKGDGPAAKDLPAKVRDLADPLVADDTDGAIFWKLTEGRQPMPSYEKLMSEEERWNVINYLRLLTLAEPRRALSGVIGPLLSVQSALVRDDLEQARSVLPKLEPAIAALSSLDARGMDGTATASWKQAQAQLPPALSALKEATDLVSFRKAFVTLSDSLSKTVATIGHTEEKPLFVFKCSKAFPGSVAAWVQAGDQAQNPYLGTKSPTCGDRDRELAPAPARGTIQKGK